MNIIRFEKQSFTVIGMEGSTKDGLGFIAALWEKANSRFGEVAYLAKKHPDGTPVGVWGVMSDFSRSFAPWENGFSEGLYLAGVECEDGADAPEGWTKWVVPGYEYLRVENDAPDIFPKTLEYMAENGLSLAGAVHDFTDPKTGKGYMCFPVRRLRDDLKIADTCCGLVCGGCDYVESCGCMGCIATGGNPFHGECPVAKCCIERGLLFCGQCRNFPCELLDQYSNDPVYGDGGERIRNCRRQLDARK